MLQGEPRRDAGQKARQGHPSVADEEAHEVAQGKVAGEPRHMVVDLSVVEVRVGRIRVSAVLPHAEGLQEKDCGGESPYSKLASVNL